MANQAGSGTNILDTTARNHKGVRVSRIFNPVCR
jgi:hypothetical protein